MNKPSQTRRISLREAKFLTSLWETDTQERGETVHD
jgi:hypothetical protein